MRKEFKPKSWFFPLPVLMIGTYDDDGNPDVMNAAWGGLYDSDEVVLCLSPVHRTTKNILRRKAFTISFPGKDMVCQADLAGLISANQYPDKVEKIGLHASKAGSINAPVFEEFPLSLECTLEKITDDGNIIGKICAISAEESCLAQDGLPDLEKMKILCYEPVRGEYAVMSGPVAKAFECGNTLLKDEEH